MSPGPMGSHHPDGRWADVADVQNITAHRPTAELERRFPGAVAWYGLYTRRWWAIVPMRGSHRLIEAGSPQELSSAIVAMARRPVPKHATRQTLIHDTRESLREALAAQPDPAEQPMLQRRMSR